MNRTNSLTTSTTHETRTTAGGQRYSQRHGPNRDLIRQVYADADADELEQVAQFYAPDSRLTQSPGHPVPGTWTRQEATDAGIRVFQTWGTTGVTVYEIIADGPHRVIGAHGTSHDGQPWTMPVTECFWIEDGKITDIRPFYWGLVELHRVAGKP